MVELLYVDHPNGYTSVYAHMMEFKDSIEQYIQKNATRVPILRDRYISAKKERSVYLEALS